MNPLQIRQPPLPFPRAFVFNEKSDILRSLSLGMVNNTLLKDLIHPICRYWGTLLEFASANDVRLGCCSGHPFEKIKTYNFDKLSKYSIVLSQVSVVKKQAIP